MLWGVIKIGIISIELAVVLTLAAFVMMIIDSSIGMYYGTILSPLLVGFGFNPLLVIPSLLLSQTVGDLAAIPVHHRFKNADFWGVTRDVKVVLAMVVPGLAAVAIAATVALSVPSWALKTCIGLVVLTMSGLVLSGVKYSFKMWKHCLYGTVASFFKCLSGGGFGPLTSTGGIIGGLEPRVSVATTSFAELLICFASFASYLILRGMVDPYFAGSLCVGAFFGGLVGPYVASRVNQKMLRNLIAIFGVVSGVWLLWRVLF